VVQRPAPLRIDVAEVAEQARDRVRLALIEPAVRLQLREIDARPAAEERERALRARIAARRLELETRLLVGRRDHHRDALADLHVVPAAPRALDRRAQLRDTGRADPAIRIDAEDGL